MFYLILFAVIMTIFVLLLVFYDGDFLTEAIGNSILSAFFLSLVVGLLVGGIVAKSSPNEYKIMSTESLLVIQDNKEIEGSFFLGCGTINGNMKYVYIVEEEFGQTMKSINVNDVYLKETQDNEPKIVHYKQQVINRKLNFWFLTDEWLNDTKTVIEVPNGTIKYDYNIDLQ